MLIAVLALGLLMPASAEAVQWRMRYGQAKHATKEYAQDTCEELRECTAWGVGQCFRRSLSRFSCSMGTFFPGVEPGEEIECRQVLHWGVSFDGYVELKARGRPHCF